MRRIAPVLLSLLLGLAGVWLLAQRTAPRTATEYAAKHGGTVVARWPAMPGGTQLPRSACGRYPLVLTDRLGDVAAALPGYVIANPAQVLALPTAAARAFALAHECGHQFVGASETQADCFAVRRLRATGELADGALERICAFLTPLRASAVHLAGRQRCALLRRCAVRTRPGEEPA